MVEILGVDFSGAAPDNNTWVAAGALVTPNKRVKNGELWMGRPAKFVRPVSNQEREEIERVAAAYAARAKEYTEAMPATS